MKNNRYVMVTGASGFIGKTLLSYLLDKGYRVFALHNKNEIDLNSERLIKIKVDLSKSRELGRLKKYMNSVSAVIHLAGNIPRSAIDKNRIPDDSIMNKRFVRILNNKIFMIFVSSVDAADKGIINDPGAYGINKFKSEKIFQEAYKNNPQNLCILRLSHTYGPGDTSDKIINKIIKSSLGYDKINITHPEDTRDYIFIDDACRILCSVVDNRCCGEYFLASGKKITMRDLYDLIINRKKVKLSISKYYKNNIATRLGIRLSNLYSGVDKTRFYILRSLIKKGNCRIFCDLDGVIFNNKIKYYKLHTFLIKNIFGKNTKLSMSIFWNLKRKKIEIESLLSHEGILSNGADGYNKRFAQLIEDRKFLIFDRVNHVNIEAIKRMSENNKIYLTTLRRDKDNLKWQLNHFSIANLFSKIINPTSNRKGIGKALLVRDNISTTGYNLVIGDTEEDSIAAKANNITSLSLSSGIREDRFLKQCETDIIRENLMEF